MRRSSAMAPAGAILTAMATTLVLGCGGSPRGSTVGEAGSAISLSDLQPIPKGGGGGATRLVMILPPEPSAQEVAWKEAARKRAAAAGVIFSARSPGAGEGQEGLIRRVVREGASGLIVVPAAGGGQALADAVIECRDQGVPTLTIRDAIGPEGGAQAAPVVVRDDPGPAAAALVEAAMADAPLLGRSSGGPGLVLFNPDLPEARARADALFASATEAGLALIGGEPMAYTGDRSSALAAIRAAQAEHRDLAMVFGADDLGISAAVTARNEGKDADRFVVSGFVVDPSMNSMIGASFVSAAAIADEAAMGRLAVHAVLDLVRGGAVADRIVAPLPVRRAPNSPAAVPSMPGSSPSAASDPEPRPDVGP